MQSTPPTSELQPPHCSRLVWPRRNAEKNQPLGRKYARGFKRTHGPGGAPHQDVNALVAVSQGARGVRRRAARVELAAGALARALRRRRWRFLARALERVLVEVRDKAVRASTLRVKRTVAALLRDKVAALGQSACAAAKVCAAVSPPGQWPMRARSVVGVETHWTSRADRTGR